MDEAQRIHLHATHAPHPHDGDNAPQNGNVRTFGQRVISVVITVAPHITVNIFLSALKGMELAFTRPMEKLGELGVRLGGNHQVTRTIGCGVGYFFGFIVGITAVVPGLLIGIVYGVGRAIYKLPSAMKTSWNQGVSYAMNETFDYYNINKRHVTAIGAVISMLLASGFIALGGLIGGPPLAGLIAILEAPAFLAGLTTLAYIYSQRAPHVENLLPAQQQDLSRPAPADTMEASNNDNFLSPEDSASPPGNSADRNLSSTMMAEA
ncbi:hypothetical protein GCM10023116_43850 [Kistimonas scapharcae]|uniref:DUF4013 domain-containing protein n=1 Tax=Kistimonas scapharcae TaxID=1036133 RepID=A0ABP8V9P7_9GAMM